MDDTTKTVELHSALKELAIRQVQIWLAEHHTDHPGEILRRYREEIDENTSCIIDESGVVYTIVFLGKQLEC